ncbi:MAG TPA: Cys-Xaa-Xaa-Xaa repeat radical SAM target protein [Syntrophales bacterium]|nr:Cys-Xaa-Xaa-Xaa repeat radical SAM target protein [Syntrophales bacterium]
MKKGDINIGMDRREFLSKAGKALLPVLSILGLAALGLSISGCGPARPDCSGCTGNCYGECTGGCDGSCKGGCSGQCFSTCGGTCRGTCSTYCAYGSHL